MRRSSWLADPCLEQFSSDGELLLHQIEIDWRPPASAELYKERQLIITALGKGKCLYITSKNEICTCI